MNERAAGPTRQIRGLAWTVLLFLILPLAVVLPVSLTDQRFLSLPQHGISLQYYANLLHSEDWQTSIVQSLLVACVSSAIAVTLGTLCAVGCWRMGTRWARAVQALMLIPIVVPTIVYALGLYRAYAKLGLLDTLTGVMVAHSVTAIPYVVVIVATALTGIDARLEQARPVARGWAAAGDAPGVIAAAAPGHAVGARSSPSCIAGTSWSSCCSSPAATCSRFRGGCGMGSTTNWTPLWLRSPSSWWR